MMKSAINIKHNLAMVSFILGDNIFKKLVTLFEKEGVDMKDRLKEAVRKAKDEDLHICEVILNDNAFPEDKALKALSSFFDVPAVYLRDKVIAPWVINLIPRDISERYRVIIFKKVKDEIHVATTAPENEQLLEFISKKTGLNPKLFITAPSDIDHALRYYRNDVKEELSRVLESAVGEAAETENDTQKMAGLVPAVKMVDNVIEKAIASGASDIHIESAFDKMVVRFRIDGILNKMIELPKSMQAPTIARIKILAGLKIDEHMVPQDGRFQFKHDGQNIAIRVSIIPTLHGPKAALRILEMKQKVFTLNKLGLNKVHFKLLKDNIKASQGMLLVTGPTGSGKTTTLYTILRILNREDVNICTIEDPIEYGIENVNQMQVRPHVGLTFASGLRSLLRQDPNIVMIGEIRDKETADIAVNSSMTGHFVLSTLHTNNAFLAPQRMIEMGLQPYLVSAVTNLVIGQRLVRRLCQHCRVPVRSTDKLLDHHRQFLDIDSALSKLKKVGLIPEESGFKDLQLYKKGGCSRCSHTGYRGRVGIYEVIKVDDNLKGVILQDGSEMAVKNHLANSDVLTMAEDGVLKVLSGRTTFEEVLRVTKE